MYTQTHTDPVRLPYTNDQLVAVIAVYMVQNKHKHTNICALSILRTRGPKQLGDFRTTNQFARLSAAAD